MIKCDCGEEIKSLKDIVLEQRVYISYRPVIIQNRKLIRENGSRP